MLIAAIVADPRLPRGTMTSLARTGYHRSAG